jgi:hypothetical protein
LVESKNIDILSSELESRLDDLFGENDGPLSDDESNALKEHYPLAELKNLILSIDWEITDEVLDSFLQQIKDLRLTYEHDKIITAFLQILNSLGNYIKINRAKAHPRTFKILNSVFSSLDRVVLSGDMPDNTKKKILRVEMNRYQELRDQIAKSKAGVGKQKKSTRPAVVDKPEVKQSKKAPELVEEHPLLVEDQPKLDEEQPILVEEKPLLVEEKPSEPPAVAAREELILADEQPEVAAAIETLTQAVEEIKRCIHVEIKALKEEIQNLRMGK